MLCDSFRNSRTGGAGQVKLVGFDFGSTTSSAMFAEAKVGVSCATGRMEFASPRVIYRSEPVFTPFAGTRIDARKIERYLDQWLIESGIENEEIFAGGAIVTGLAASSENAAAIAHLVEKRIGEAIIATAQDPALESWLAFMGSCSALSRCHAARPVLNLDIGGGTTNPALGLNGDVLATGCYFVGARHFQFVPGSYRLTAVSDYGRALLQHLGIPKTAGDSLAAGHIQAILAFYVDTLKAVTSGNRDFFTAPIARLHEQVPFHGDSCRSAMLVFSGGVGELVYRHAAGRPLPGTTYYGDLGIDLAGAIVEDPLLAAHVHIFQPENGGRATVYGLTLYSTEVSGTTLFLPDPKGLPLRDLPVVARLAFDAGEQRIADALALVQKSSRGACIRVDGNPAAGSPERRGPSAQPTAAGSFAAVKRFGLRLAEAIACARISPERPLVILTAVNVGKAIGNYATNWGQLPVNLLVIDEIPERNAQFVNIGRPHNNVVPVSFYGMH